MPHVTEATCLHSAKGFISRAAGDTLSLILKSCFSRCHLIVFLTPGNQSPRTKLLHLCFMAKSETEKRDQGPPVPYSDLWISVTMLYLPLAPHPGDKVLNAWSACEDHRLSVWTKPNLPWLSEYFRVHPYLCLHPQSHGSLGSTWQYHLV